MLALNHEVHEAEEMCLQQNKPIPAPAWLAEGKAALSHNSPKQGKATPQKPQKSSDYGGLFAQPQVIEQEILENFDEQYHDLVKELLAKGMNFNKDGYFSLRDPKTNTIIAQAELGIFDTMQVYGPLDEQSRKVFEGRGFKVSSL